MIRDLPIPAAEPSLIDDLAKLQAQHDRDRAEIARLDAQLVEARAERDRMRPVYEATKVAASDRYTERRELVWYALNMAVRTAIAAEAEADGRKGGK